MWETRDPDGRPVVLERQGWRHILVKHRELRMTREELLAVVSAPDERIVGRDENEEWFYSGGFGPSVWVKVVVHSEGGSGLIVTAFARRSFP